MTEQQLTIKLFENDKISTCTNTTGEEILKILEHALERGHILVKLNGGSKCCHYKTTELIDRETRYSLIPEKVRPQYKGNSELIEHYDKHHPSKETQERRIRLANKGIDYRDLHIDSPTRKPLSKILEKRKTCEFCKNIIGLLGTGRKFNNYKQMEIEGGEIKYYHIDCYQKKELALISDKDTNWNGNIKQNE